MAVEDGPPKDPSASAAIECYLSPGVHQLTKSATPALGGSNIEATCLVVRLAGLDSAFKDPQEEAVYISTSYLEVADRILHRHEGVIQEVWAHDEMQVSFGVPPDMDNHALKAVTAALELRAALRNFRESKSNIRIGIGVNTGVVFNGNIGSPDRFQLGIYGNTVRYCYIMAEAASSNLRSNLRIGEDTLKALPENYLTTELSWLQTPRSTIRTYTVFGLQES